MKSLGFPFPPFLLIPQPTEHTEALWCLAAAVAELQPFPPRGGVR